MATVKILAIDGGTRPLLACLMLRRLSEACPGLLDQVDVFAGTSSGAITCAAIAAAKRAEEGLGRAIALWERWQPFAGTSPLSPRVLGAVSGHCAFLTHEHLYTELRALFGQMRLEDLQRQVVIPLMMLDNQVFMKQRRHWSIEIAHNLGRSDGVVSPPLFDVVMRSSAIPVLHPVFQGHVDGGLYANNPSLCALATARDFLNAEPSDMLVLSIGQGLPNTYMSLERGDVGYGTWLFDPQNPMALIKLVMNANAQATNYQISRILEDRYIRLDPVLAADIEPNPSMSQTEFNRQQAVMVEDVDLSSTLEQLDEIAWTRAPDPASTA